MLAIFVLASCSFWSYCPDYQSCILFIRILPTISLLGNFPFAPNVLFWAQLLLGHVVYVVVKISPCLYTLHFTPYTIKIAQKAILFAQFKIIYYLCAEIKKIAHGYTKDQY